MALSMTAKSNSKVRIRDAVSLLALSVLWFICVIRLWKDFTHMPLDHRCLYGVGACLLLVGIINQTPKVLAPWRAPAA